MRTNLLLATSLSLISTGALAKALECNADQTQCIVKDRADLTIGDQVGIFNEDGDMVATAEVTRMRDEKRALTINSRTGQIQKDDRIALLDTSAIDGAPPLVTHPYREPPKAEVGASIGYSTITLGDSVPGVEATGYYQMRKWGQYELIGRGVVEASSGKTSNTTVDGKQTMTMTGIGLLGGLGYEWFASQPVSLRIEGAIGAMHVASTVDGSRTPVDDGSANIHVKNGVSPYARWSIGGIYNVCDQWHVHLDFAESIVYQAFANTLALGISHDLP